MRKIVVALVVMTLLFSIVPLGTEEVNASAKKIEPGKAMMNYAKLYRGSRYKLGGTYLKNLKKPGDKNRTDCQGFVYGIVKRYIGTWLKGRGYKAKCRFAYKLGATKVGKGKKALKKAKPGDIIFYKPKRGRQHVAFFYGKKGGRYLQLDATRGKGVAIRKIPRKRVPVLIIRLEKVIEKRSAKYKALID